MLLAGKGGWVGREGGRGRGRGWLSSDLFIFDIIWGFGAWGGGVVGEHLGGFVLRDRLSHKREWEREIHAKQTHRGKLLL